MSLPLTKMQALKAAQWMRHYYGAVIRAAVPQPFNEYHLYAMACQETACYWLPWIDTYVPGVILARCVFDASGDLGSSPRSAFPRNTDAFRARYGHDFTDMLIAEGNETRKMRGYHNWRVLYKGYGIWQYDLQFVVEDEIFFRGKLWHLMTACLERVCKELRATWKLDMTIPGAIMRYNGSGARARQYSKNVMQFYDWIKE